MVSTMDYPRVGGEEKIGCYHHVTVTGLPPRGRGRAPPHPSRRAAVGITPAWAGKSHRTPHAACTIQDYPRVGGEERKSATSR